MHQTANPFITLLTVLLLCLGLGACASGKGGGHGLHETGTVRGLVVDLDGRAVAGAEVTTSGSRRTTSADDGTFTLRPKTATDRLPITVSARGFRDTTVIARVETAAETSVRVTLQRRSRAVPFDAGTGGRITSDDGAALDLPAAALVDRRGRPANGRAQATITVIPIEEPAGLGSAPGDFSARQEDGSLVLLESYGMAEVLVEDADGAPLELAPDRTARLSLPIAEESRETAPAEVGLYRFDPATGLWLERGTLRRSDDGLTYDGQVDSFGDWNADVPMDTTCITVRVLDLLNDNQPIGGVEVKASGVDYAAISSGTTNSDGEVCLLVKRDAQVELRASSPIDLDRVSQPRTLDTPDIASGADDCGDCFDCPPVATLVLDLIVGR